MITEKILLMGNWGTGTDAVAHVLKKEGITFQKVLLDEYEIQLKKTVPDIVLLILSEKEAKDTTLISTIRQAYEHLPLMVISDPLQWEGVVNIMKAGATDFMALPLAKEK
ncbi:MAG: hypothetical protein ACD_73C00058G0001, partial [uncultured bacterium]